MSEKIEALKAINKRLDEIGQLLTALLSILTVEMAMIVGILFVMAIEC